MGVEWVPLDSKEKIRESNQDLIWRAAQENPPPKKKRNKQRNKGRKQTNLWPFHYIRAKEKAKRCPPKMASRKFSGRRFRKGRVVNSSTK